MESVYLDMEQEMKQEMKQEEKQEVNQESGRGNINHPWPTTATQASCE